jgi:hypothetical protein
MRSRNEMALVADYQSQIAKMKEEYSKLQDKYMELLEEERDFNKMLRYKILPSSGGARIVEFNPVYPN